MNTLATVQHARSLDLHPLASTYPGALAHDAEHPRRMHVSEVLSGSHRWTVTQGDCLDILRTMPDGCVDALVTDPPAAIGFMGKAWDKDKGGRDPWIAWLTERMREAHRVMKPGAYGLVWALPRTSHWTGLALEHAGFEVRDRVAHVFGTGFPKGENLKPATEDWWLIRKRGKSALNIEECRVGNETIRVEHMTYGGSEGWSKNRRTGESSQHVGRWPAHLVLSHAEGCEPTGDTWQCGNGCPIALMNEQSGECPTSGTVKQGKAILSGITTYGAGWGGGTTSNGYNDSEGASRFFTNLPPFFYTPKASRADRERGCEHLSTKGSTPRTHLLDRLVGQITPPGFPRLFPPPRVSAPLPPQENTRRNTHPTVKSTELMRWLVKLITPPDGLVLDMFCGSGSTGVGCIAEGFRFIGIDTEAEYIPIARARIGSGL